jgi:hypothetical protein
VKHRATALLHLNARQNQLDQRTGKDLNLSLGDSVPIDIIYQRLRLWLGNEQRYCALGIYTSRQEDKPWFMLHYP